MKVYLLFAAFLSILPFFHFVVPILLSKLSGWSRLSERFSSSIEPYGEVHIGETISINTTRYREVDISLSDHGVSLKLSMLSHPDLFIPWQNFSRVEEIDYYGAMFYHKLTIGEPATDVITLDKRIPLPPRALSIGKAES
jgi:hypothetical protein